MILSETRIVLFEKHGHFGRGYANLYSILDEIDVQIKTSKKKNIKMAYVFDGWLKKELIQKILKDNGYNIIRFEDTLRFNGFSNQRFMSGIIIWD